MLRAATALFTDLAVTAKLSETDCVSTRGHAAFLGGLTEPLLIYDPAPSVLAIESMH